MMKNEEKSGRMTSFSVEQEFCRRKLYYMPPARFTYVGSVGIKLISSITSDSERSAEGRGTVTAGRDTCEWRVELAG